MNIEPYKQILTKYWGYTSFKPLQEEIIRSVAEGRDTLGLMPTGGGKSITFQVPALATRRDMSGYHSTDCPDERSGKPP